MQRSSNLELKRKKFKNRKIRKIRKSEKYFKEIPSNDRKYQEKISKIF